MFRRRLRSSSPLSRGLLLALLVLTVSLAVAGPVIATLRDARPKPSLHPTAKVRRADVEGKILAAGHVSSTRSTEIRCMLERLASSGQGAALTSGASTILSLVDDGSTVKRGDILCEMDGSEFSELVRRQQIVVEQATAERMQALLGLDVAKMSLESYREGEQKQVEQQYQGQIALAQADLARQTDRVGWARRMLEKGYASVAQVRSEEQSQARIEVSLTQTELALANYRRFSIPKELLMLGSQVVSAQATLNFQTIRLKREEERLAHYQSMLDRCTIRAPHDGYVVLANRSGREPRVYLGAPVRERMQLFTLPDQSNLEIEVLLHETMVDRVRPNMTASIHIEALPDEIVVGELESIGAVPLSDQNQQTGNGVTYFLAHLRLDTLPPRLRPGMTAEVSISTGLRRDVLAVPSRAVLFEEDREVCYVDHEESVERRIVKVSPANQDLLEVVDGLSEGEDVVLDPENFQAGLTH